MPFKRTKKTYDEPALYEYAIGALSRKMRAVAELKRLLRQRTQDEGMIDAVIARLKEQRYLNDAQYASAYSSYRKANEKFGKMRVITGLKARGVHGDVIAKAVEAAYTDVDEEQLAREYLRRKRVPKPADQKGAARVFRSLMRGGFSRRSAVRVLSRWEVDPEVVSALEAEDEPSGEGADE
jgi:regulatory protein